MPQNAKTRKRLRQTANRRLRNKSVKSHLKRRIKKFEAAISENSVDEAKMQALLLQRSLDKAAGHGIIHKKKAGRKVASTALKLNKLLRASDS